MSIQTENTINTCDAAGVRVHPNQIWMLQEPEELLEHQHTH
jgi:hypothetical protein